MFRFMKVPFTLDEGYFQVTRQWRSAQAGLTIDVF